MNQEKEWIWLSKIDGLRSKKIQALLKKYPNISDIPKLKKEELIQVEGIQEKLAEKILDKKYRENIEKYLEYMQKQDIKIINYFHPSYPEKLKNIYDPPMVLYVKGDETILNEFSIGIIGCRDCTSYGKEVAYQLSKQLAQKKVHIISGLAKGIDSYAHLGCLAAEERTIAVIGNGLDSCYPAENTLLQEKIWKTGGAVISEYLIGTKPEKGHFPARNRIISGISNGLLVVEAKEKSGTLITVDFALEQGKNIFAVPGNITSINSYGTNQLIREGAKIITSVEDILEEYS